MDPNGYDELDSKTLLAIIALQAAIARQGSDLGAVLDLVARGAQDLTGAMGAAVEMAEDGDMVYRGVAGVTSSMLGMRLRRENSLSGLCVREGRILQCEDSETDERVDRAACRRVGLRSMLVVPLRHLEETVGVVKVMSPHVGGFPSRDVRVLGLLSGLVAAAMFNAARHESSDLYYRATHDALTGIANRSLFFDRLRQVLARALREHERVGVLVLDMDGLKPINDGLGHHAGDLALRELALRLEGSCRQSDTVARLGGDEFSVILAPVEDRAAAEAMRERVAERIAEPFPFQGEDLALSASIGLALFPDDATDMQPLVDRADQDMYERKRARQRTRRASPAPPLER